MPHSLDRYHALITREELDPAHVGAMLRLRKRLFVDHCGWLLSTTGDVERDQFDSWYTEHCLLFAGAELVGGFRAIRTDYPYLTKSVFPQLAVRRFPSRRDAWEISRFGVLPSVARSRTARVNYALMFRFAELRGAAALVALADLSYERFLTRMDIRTRRYGPPQVIGNDRMGRPLTALAGEIPLGLADNPGLTKFLDLGRQLEIHDASHVLGRSSIPA
ncbi:GNAT family N-acetyltransferase [Bradyrhizobium sp. Pear76]|uniref:acyl-homoserine-lactone synthase n=1 Tax=Bradyrhizobium oropedii TaxID=1571201 RepID=UPI001E315B79|nr:acyl-homoserine-lactone synthase [Bradyrhizobium oropedii]MCC8965070.1 GNAT family N-acetyltransferase [Bradyrhizobium oropedii]